MAARRRARILTVQPTPQGVYRPGRIVQAGEGWDGDAVPAAVLEDWVSAGVAEPLPAPAAQPEAAAEQEPGETAAEPEPAKKKATKRRRSKSKKSSKSKSS